MLVITKHDNDNNSFWIANYVLS